MSTRATPLVHWAFKGAVEHAMKRGHSWGTIMLHPSLLLVAAAYLSSAQPASTPDEAPPPALAAAGQAYMACLEAGLEQVASEVAPRTAARNIVRSCQEPRQRLVAAHRQWIDGSSMSEPEKRQARAQSERELAGVEAQLVRAVVESRSED